MNISVLVKQTFATEAKIRLTREGRLDPTGIKHVVNPYDEFALEEALRIQEKLGGTVRIFCVGPPSTEEAIRHGLAMGAQEAVHIVCEGVATDPALVAEWLARALARKPFDLILAGKVAIDRGAGEIPGRVAERLNLPLLNVVSQLLVSPEAIVAYRETEGATEVLQSALPALVTAEKGLNEPRYPKLPNVLKAKSKRIEVLTPADLGITTLKSVGLETLAVELPSPRRGAVMLSGTVEEMCDQLVEKLRYETKVV